MSPLQAMLEKARRALLRRGVLMQDTDDIVQDAFLRVEEYERKQHVRSREALLVTAAVNLSMDRARRRRDSPFVDVADELLQVADRTPPPDEIVRAQARLRRAAEGLDTLPERTRRILLSRRLDGLSFKQIAQTEGMTVAAVEKQVARATLELMKWMDGW
ncbi:RNA polymerase sigma factor, sigma-70 family protein [Asticcacaulis biprosthecium C19]|uniref:RNA polymerase sigma factor, sigma-70 family protein n=1 Tax=Asticcacaulis biprosthecium C19 TaxID=715226 RepID=F4QN78_9CAUL|nr:sigma-70 family RNA polymerase sigma factor [Asticcacaulis biprosthecium]EGF91669.1 RNA polymerase sigma factor, sigma-70 family protein [Asticcacaulis biprosthecium C19]